MANPAGKAKVIIGLDSTAVLKGLKRMRRNFDKFGNNLIQTGGKFVAFGASVVGVLGLITNSFIKAGDEIGKIAKRTGISTDAVQELGFVFEQAGGSLSDFEKVIKSIGTSLLEPETKFKRLGLALEELEGLSVEEKFFKIGKAISEVKDETKRGGLATDIFGRGGLNALVVFQDGLENVDRLRRKLRNSGALLTQEEIKNAEALADSFNFISKQIKKVVFAIGNTFSKSFVNLEQSIVDVTNSIKAFIENNGELLKFFAIGAVASIAFGSALIVLGLAFKGLALGIGVLGGVITLFVSILTIANLQLVAFSIVLVALANSFLTLTDAGRTLASDMDASFKSIASIASDTIGGIINSLKGGDLVNAGNIAMLGLEIVFEKSLFAIRKKWNDFETFIESIFIGIARKFSQVANTLKAFKTLGTELLSGSSFKASFDKATFGLIQDEQKFDDGFSKLEEILLKKRNKSEAETQKAIDKLIAELKARTDNAKKALDTDKSLDDKTPKQDTGVEALPTPSKISGFFNAFAVRGIGGDVQQRLLNQQETAEKQRKKDASSQLTVLQETLLVIRNKPQTVFS